jgi:hypothetical protein
MALGAATQQFTEHINTEYKLKLQVMIDFFPFIIRIKYLSNIKRKI